MGERWIGIILVGVFLSGCASEEVSKDFPRDNKRPRGDRDPIDYLAGETGSLQDEVAFFADLDRKMKSWVEATNGSDHAIAQAMERILRDRVRGRFTYLVETLRDGARHDRSIAVLALGFSSDPRAVAPLLDVVLDPDLDGRINGLQALGILHDPETPVDPVIACLSDPDPAVRAAAAYCLGGIVPPKTDKGALVPLLKAIQDPDLAVRANATISLGFLGNHMATQSLISSCLFDEDWIVRRNACASLGRIRDPRAVVPLLERFDDEQPSVREMAELSLVAITGEKFGRNRRAWEEWAEENLPEGQ
jgi:hypothetical protein